MIPLYYPSEGDLQNIVVLGCVSKSVFAKQYREMAPSELIRLFRASVFSLSGACSASGTLTTRRSQILIGMMM